MLPIKGMQLLSDKLDRKVDKSEGDSVVTVSHRTYDFQVKYENYSSCYSLFHYGTKILEVNVKRIDALNFEDTVSVDIYSSSDRNAINAMLEVMNVHGYKFNIHGENVWEVI